MIEFSYDREVNAAYVKLSRNKIKETTQVHPQINLDLDKKGRIVGIEILFALRIDK
jgi:uncharacterized protein YuzE